MRLPALVLLIAGAWLAGCTVPSGRPIAPAFDGEKPWPPLQEAGGFDSLDPDAIWSAGDFVRYAIEATAEGATHAWTLELALPTVPGPAPERFLSGFVRTRSAISNTKRDKATNTHFTWYAWYPVALRLRLEKARTGEVFTTEVPTQGHAHVWQQRVDTNAEFGIRELFWHLLEVDRLLEELLAVVKPPSMWSVVGNGMSVSVALKLHRPDVLEVIEVDTPFGRVPAFWLPATLMANGQEALECRFLITWRRSPLLLSMGVLRIEGRHPDDANRRVDVHVIAARRGQADQVPDRDDLGPAGVRKGMSEPAFVAALDGKFVQRYRVTSASGAIVDLVVVEHGMPPRSIVGAFEDGRLLYCSHAGHVSAFLEHRGFAPGPYRKENLVPTGDGHE